jgi:hypothetical protein
MLRTARQGLLIIAAVLYEAIFGSLSTRISQIVILFATMSDEETKNYPLHVRSIMQAPFFGVSKFQSNRSGGDRFNTSIGDRYPMILILIESGRNEPVSPPGAFHL